jgi:hypothetical protein
LSKRDHSKACSPRAGGRLSAEAWAAKRRLDRRKQAHKEHMRFSRYAATISTCLAAWVFSTTGLAQAENAAPNQARNYVGIIAPVFSQLMYFHVPANFVPVFEKTSRAGYIHEWVLPGESVSDWTQMVTATSAPALSVTHPELTPRGFAQVIAGGFKRACPSSFAATQLYQGTLNAQDTFIVVVSCGDAPASAGHSETSVIAVVKGEKDFYTLQWAQRANPSPTPIKIEPNMWGARIKALLPLKLCPIVPGEKAPYPSCVGH